MSASRGLLSGFFCGFGARWAARAWLAGALSGCTLITDVDRERIPPPVTPVFPEVDAGPIPPQPTPDASTPDAAAPVEPGDAGASDAGSDDGGDTNAGDSGLPGDAG